MPSADLHPGTSASTLVINDTVWMLWNQAYGHTTSITGTTSIMWHTAGVTWATWNYQYSSRTGVYEACLEETRQTRDRWNIRKQAASKAEELLLSLLSEEQARTYQEHDWFEVRGSRGGRWRIRNRGQSGNVDLMPEIGDEREATYCAHPPGDLPDADAYVAQMLHLVTDEDDFKRTANLHYQRPGHRAA